MSWIEMASFIVGIAGAVISLGGFVVAIWQIHKTRKAAEAASETTKATQGMLTKNVILTDTTKLIGTIREVKAYLSSSRYDAASVKLQEFQSKLVELRHLFKEQTSLPEKNFQAIFSQLSIINDKLEAKAMDTKCTFDIEQTNKILSRIVFALQDWLGKGKYDVAKEKTNDTGAL